MDDLCTGTAYLSDESFVEEFESCRLPTAQFHHADHIRLAWIFLGQMDEAEATRRIERAIQRYAEHNGIGQKYHHTITLAWMKLVKAAVRGTPGGDQFAAFAAANPELFDVQLLKLYYSRELLESPRARAEWVEPDLRKLRDH